MFFLLPSNFVNSFRETGANWTSLPQAFKEQGYYTTSVGKVFHPRLPPDFDFPKSWSDVPIMPDKPACPFNTMTCAFKEGDLFRDADADTTGVALKRLRAWAQQSHHQQQQPQPHQPPLFLAVGYQSPRLPWSYPAAVASRYPSPQDIPIAEHPNATGTSELEWFRPTEVDMYSDVRNITHYEPLRSLSQHQARLAYYAAITHVDDQVGVLLREVEALGLQDSTVVVLFSGE